MNVLITGATGYIGGAVAEAVAGAGHVVHALAHSNAAADAVVRRGWTPAPGTLHDPRALSRLVGGMDAVIHAANTGGADAARVDTAATRAILEGLRGAGRTFVYTSGAWVLGAGRTDETSAARPAALVSWRAALEQEIRGAAPDIATVVLRPGIVFGRGGGIPGMIVRGELPVVGVGVQRWPLVHVEDLADLYVRALAAAPATILHGVAETVPLRALVRVLTTRTVPSVSLGEARVRLGAFADALALDQAVDSRRTREWTGWSPRHAIAGVAAAGASIGRTGIAA